MELSSAAEIAVVPTSPEVDTREPVMSAYERITHQLPFGCHPLLVWVRTPVRRLGQPPGLRDHRGDIGLGTGAVGVPIPDPAPGYVPAAAECVDAQRQQVLVAGLCAVWLTPYRKPSPTPVAGPVTDARFTLSDSAAAARWAGASSVAASVSVTAAATDSRWDLILALIASPSSCAAWTRC
jgi:hypothetical protein